MKPNKSKRQILDISALEEEFFEDVRLLGIVCPLIPYRFVWLVEQNMQIPFTRNHSHEILLNENYFQVYTYHQLQPPTEHVLYTNRMGIHYLLPELKNVDFIWLIKGHYTAEETCSQLLGHLPNLRSINHVFALNVSNVKSKQHLIL